MEGCDLKYSDGIGLGKYSEGWDFANQLEGWDGTLPKKEGCNV